MIVEDQFDRGTGRISGIEKLEALWTLDADGRFVAPVSDSRGIVLRPDDYHFVELLKVPEEPTDG
jgi:hypothetical protein